MKTLKRYIENSGLTQTEFAIRVGVRQPTVCNWLNGTIRPSVDRLRVIARVSKLPFDRLFQDFYGS